MFEHDEQLRRAALRPITDALRAQFAEVIGALRGAPLPGSLTPVAYHASGSWIVRWDAPDGAGGYAWIDSEGAPAELFAETREQALSLAALGAGALYDVLTAAIETVDGGFIARGWSREGWDERVADIESRALGAVDRARWRSEGVTVADRPVRAVIALLQRRRLPAG